MGLFSSYFSSKKESAKNVAAEKEKILNARSRADVDRNNDNRLERESGEKRDRLERECRQQLNLDESNERDRLERDRLDQLRQADVRRER